jgi:hypothetical protein
METGRVICTDKSLTVARLKPSVPHLLFVGLAAFIYDPLIRVF